MDLSIVIICRNEEDRIGRCLASLPKEAQIVVLDSYSEDNTVPIAKTFGAKVSHRHFDNYAAQRNAALALADRKWILSIDADEELSPELKAEVLRAIAQPRADAYRLPRQLVFMGRKLRFGKTNDQPLRLFQKGRFNFVGAIHERAVGEGKIGCLKGKLWHYSYRNISDYFARFNRYTTLIAQNHRELGDAAPFGFTFRLYWEFFSRFVLRLGFLDGYPGYVFAVFSSFYAYVKYLKLHELEGQRQ